MENMQYAEELVREFMIFRGFTNTLQAFEAELCTDVGKGFQVDKLLDLIFSVYIPKFQAEKLVGLLSFFKKCLSSSSETTFVATLAKLEVSILRYYIVYATQSGRKDKVVEFFGMNGNDLLQSGKDWTPWFAIPYLKNPSLDSQFRIYFTKEWYEALRLSVMNFFSVIFNNTRIPALLKISSDQNTVNRLKKDIKQLNLKLSQLQALLEEKEVQLRQIRSNAALATKSSSEQANNSASSNSVHEEILPRTNSQDACVYEIIQPGQKEPHQELATAEHAKATSGSSVFMSGRDLSSLSYPRTDRLQSDDNNQSPSSGTFTDVRETPGEEEFPEVKVDFQETFLGHTSPISRCRFSASGNNIASASADGTVRIWTYDSSIPATRNATIYCGAEILSLDWECKSDRLLLIGTADGGIKAWNVDAKRVVCDLNTTQAFPRCLRHELLNFHPSVLHNYNFVPLQCFGYKVQPYRAYFCFCSCI
ncbi:WD repeat-containing protein 91 homolog isoform X2 [Carica papaya]|uniref:WD repeat-containing protein 91 homolog isoform X2 n=1 Tax=Carica papaya TaxID=3649 RepID=UPI000B8C9F2B|nr:WD repeat-containing protein 91 homolog isoform X2 [Carica papaya]